MPNFYQPLELEDFEFNDYRKEKEYASDIKNLGSKFVSFLESLNLFPSHVLVLWRPAGGRILQHSDGDLYRPNWARLNFIHGGPAENLWWSPIGDVPETFGSFPCKRWEPENLVLKETAELTGFNIMNVGQPHAVQDIKSDRWSVSIELKYQNNKYIDFEVLKNIFQKYHREK